MSLINEAKQQLGSLFIVGFSGLELGQETADFLKKARIGGTILFTHNYENPGQVAELTNQIQECRPDLPLWIGVDHEGGRVQRFKKPFTRIPDAATITAHATPKKVFDIAEMMARELGAVGVNLNFAPVADINTNPKNPVIGNRAFGDNEDTVSKMVTAMVRGHMVGGVQPCVKHFPGHGDTSVDSHFALPKIDTPLEVLQEREFKPFNKAFKSRCAFVMTAHILMTQIDPEFPATLSKKVISGVLREGLRYSRIVITDDMEMKAVVDHFGAAEAPRLAIEAGCDLLCYRSEAAGRAAYEALLRALDGGALSPERVIESADRLRSAKMDMLLPYEPIIVTEVAKRIGTPENVALVEDLKS